MKSVLLRRFVAGILIALLLASAFTVAGYVFFTRDTYSRIKLNEMKPKAQLVCSLAELVCSGELSRPAFESLINEMAVNSGLMIYSVDQAGAMTLMASYDGAISKRSDEKLKAALKPTVDDVLKGTQTDNGNIYIEGYGNLLAVAARTAGAGDGIFGIVVAKSSAEVYSVTRKMSATLFWLMLAIVPICTLATSWGVRKMTSPLRDMTDAAIKMSKGKFDIRLDESASGEMGILAHALNELCQKLSQTIFQLQTEKKQLDLILQSLTDGVAATDSLGMLTHYNTALMRMFGAVNVQKREELIADPKIWSAFDEAFLTGVAQTLTLPMAGDRTLWVTLSPVVTQKGKRSGVVGLFKDMTEMERLESMRKEYVANVSHELRTPLTAIRGLLEPLLDGMVTAEEDRQRYYRIMLHEVMRLSRLITDMMTLSRLQAGTEYMELSRVDINELVDDIVGGYSSPAANKEIELIVNAGKMPNALTDPDRIEQVLVILLDNAMRYTPKGGSITISVKNDDRLLISVADTGCGIPQSDLPHIFDRFYKVDKSRNEGGTGLGLSIAKFIMDKLGEKLVVESTVGKGTIFTLTVKKYVCNAIALGPSTADEHFKDRDKDSEELKDDFLTEESQIHAIDADYEVLESTGKKK